jgi:antirestriction protein ArdC
MKTNACATGERLVLPNPCAFGSNDRYAALLCHELGHANGWPPTHGDFPVAATAASVAPDS